MEALGLVEIVVEAMAGMCAPAHEQQCADRRDRKCNKEPVHSEILARGPSRGPPWPWLHSWSRMCRIAGAPFWRALSAAPLTSLIPAVRARVFSALSYAFAVASLAGCASGYFPGVGPDADTVRAGGVEGLPVPVQVVEVDAAVATRFHHLAG